MAKISKAQQAAGQLQADLNKAFLALESLKIARMRLQSVNKNVVHKLVESSWKLRN